MTDAVLVDLDAYGVRGAQGVGQALRGVDLLEDLLRDLDLVVVGGAGARVPVLDDVADGAGDGEPLTELTPTFSQVR
ncbi:hypothetical protein [Streptomyces sp. NPDC056468]|uniref:hypothetical protein n=1 Tax=Streptomyces sp. NPDC056468 TaxID=3345830 RepID=UPI0036BA11DD